MKDLRKKAEEIINKHEEKLIRAFKGNIHIHKGSVPDWMVDAMLEMYQLDRPKIDEFDVELLSKEWFNEAQLRSDIRADVKSFQEGLIMGYSLNRPKAMVFDATDPKTFPKELKQYHVKILGEWKIDKWFTNMESWEKYYLSSVTHYAEILMPE